MNKIVVLFFHLALSCFALVGTVRAADGSFADQFLGGPLLILVAVLIADAVAFAYHRIRK